MKTIKELMSPIDLQEAPRDAKDWEGVIAAGFNDIVRGDNSTDDVKFVQMYKGSKRVVKTFVDLLERIAPANSFAFALGNSVAPKNPSWKGANATVKTDILLSTNRTTASARTPKISLKMSADALLMSHEKLEAISVFEAVRDVYLKNNPDPSLRTVIANIATHFATIRTKLNSTEIKKIISAGRRMGEVAKEFLEQQGIHAALTEEFANYFSSSSEVRTWMVYEAITGKVKFQGNIGSANYLLQGTPNGATSLEPITKGTAERLSRNLRVAVRFSTNRRGKISSSMRADVRESKRKFSQVFTEAMTAQYMHLAESKMPITENIIMTMLTKAFNYVLDIVKGLFRKGIAAVMNFFDIDVETVEIEGVVA
jgi:hypothetical protein